MVRAGTCILALGADCGGEASRAERLRGEAPRVDPLGRIATASTACLVASTCCHPGALIHAKHTRVASESSEPRRLTWYGVLIVLRWKFWRLGLCQPRLIVMLIWRARITFLSWHMNVGRLLLKLHLLGDCILHVHLNLATGAQFFLISESLGFQ